MKTRQIDRLLSDRREEETPSLSPGFGEAVLGRAKRVKAALVRHRRWLVVSSIIAIAMAALISARLGDRRETLPPPLEVFPAPSLSTPASHR